jgi:uncharacterized membrane protein YeaQ/YmgE (transglycosylase-associated protein family)
LGYSGKDRFSKNGAHSVDNRIRFVHPLFLSHFLLSPFLQEMYEMGILSWIVFGLIAGALAKLLMPGDDPGGIIVTILIGIGGAIVGGFVGTQIGFGSVGGFDFRSFLIAVGGALVLLAGYRLIKKR